MPHHGRGPHAPGGTEAADPQPRQAAARGVIAASDSGALQVGRDGLEEAHQIVPGLLATGSVDKTVKIWDTTGGKPEAVAQKNLNIDEVFTVSFYGSSPWILAAGGGNGTVALWEVNENSKTEERFASRIA